MISLRSKYVVHKYMFAHLAVKCTFIHLAANIYPILSYVRICDGLPIVSEVLKGVCTIPLYTRYSSESMQGFLVVLSLPEFVSIYI